MPDEGRRRWCKPCAQAHPGSEDVGNKRCEDCKRVQPNYGVPGAAGAWAGRPLPSL
jgi:hypothetical protein